MPEKPVTATTTTNTNKIDDNNSNNTEIIYPEAGSEATMSRYKCIGTVQFL